VSGRKNEQLMNEEANNRGLKQGIKRSWEEEGSVMGKG
jgi:hypothetical protein